MPSPEYDLVYLQAALLDIQGYLLSNEVYWPIGANSPTGEPPFPRVTLGNLVLAETSLEGRNLPGDQAAQYKKLKDRLDGVRKEWRVAWSRKAVREFGARLSLWRDFIEEYRKNPRANVDRYPYEVNRRVILQLLLPEAEQVSSQEEELLEGLDNVLQAVFVEGSFVWEDELQNAFPKAEYWYLYGLPRSEDEESDS
jgi:hypothetical protein